MKHIHGGCPGYYFERFGLKEKGVIDFSININPLGPPSNVKYIWDRLLGKIHLYPSIDGKGVKIFYKKRFQILDDTILSGNGSTELIYLIPRVFPWENVLIIKPSYFDYERACRLADKGIMSIYRDPEGSDSDSLTEKIINGLHKADALWIGRPNNPTGDIFPKNRILEISEEFPKKIIIVDEAFIQFVDKWENETLISPDMPENIIVIHSLTKFYALPGVRIGAIISSPKNISLISSKKEPWSINIIAEEIAKNLYPCHEYERETASLITKERERLYNFLTSLDEIEPIKSVTNFLLCRYRRNLDHLIKNLLDRGIFIRDCRNFDGLWGSFFRIGIKIPEENDRLISALSSI